ncbi:SapC family protein [Asticcacaulis sp. AND118]|uniref:SapC family protein n=1 Tax=Asticcacaulis sp. AND118 TaxID=2840468 RepID=UPI001CFF9912|nr:SapC family protein [Asticcacaulis sp. AND118]UDF04120.1 SapC family protein [Asticcacaulis sp. AND118]
MSNAVLLDNVKHHDLRVIGGHGQSFGDSVNEIPVFATEFAELQRDYPLYFREAEGGGFQAFALLGLDKDENLFLADGQWQARHVPAMSQRGPFLIGMRDDGPMLMVDLDHPRLSRSEGEPVFLPHGGNAPALERHMRALRTIHQGVEINAAMFAALQAEGLIAPVEIAIRLDDTTEYKMPGLFSISQEALSSLSGEALERLNRAGFLSLAFQVVASMGNMARIIELKNRKRAGV